MADIKVIVGQENSIKARVGQQNSIKVISSISGSAGGRAVTAENVIGGIASVRELYVSGIATFNHDVNIEGNLNILNDINVRNENITGILTVNQSIYYSPGNPYGIAYFNQNDELVSTASTSSAIFETNYILSTNSSGIPSWANSIDGGVY